MKLGKLFTRLIVGLFFMVWALSGQASIIKLKYTATGHGGAVSGTFGYDDTFSDTNANASIGTFPAAGFMTGTITGGPQDGILFQDLSATVGTNNDGDIGGSYQDYFGINFLVSGPANYTFIEFVNTSLTAPASPLTTDQLTSPLLPNALANLDNWQENRVTVYANSQELAYTLVNLTRIPEPASGVLLSLGLAGIFYQHRRKSGEKSTTRHSKPPPNRRSFCFRKSCLDRAVF